MNRRAVTTWAPLVGAVLCGLMAILLAFALGSAAGHKVALADMGFALVMLGVCMVTCLGLLGLFVVFFVGMAKHEGPQPPGTPG